MAKLVMTGAITHFGDVISEPGIVSLDKKVIAQTYTIDLQYAGAAEGQTFEGTLSMRTTEFPALKLGQIITVTINATNDVAS